MLSINQLAWVANVLVSTVSGGAVGGHSPAGAQGTSPRGHSHLCVEGTSPSLSSAPARSLWASHSQGAGSMAGGMGPIAGKGMFL